MNLYYPFVNEPLPYGYDSLEPYIDEKTMELHHDKHLQAYIDRLNELLKGCPALQKKSLTALLQGCCRRPSPLWQQIRNQAGGVYNHRFFFAGMEPPGGGIPEGNLLWALTRQYGSFARFWEQFREAALALFGSGYVWLVWERGRLCITTTANQNTPLEKGQCPILALDVWEHAYYLKHYNVRASYIDDWFRVVNWTRAENLLTGLLYPDEIGVYDRSDCGAQKEQQHDGYGSPAL